MNGPDLSSAAIPELVPLTGVSRPVRPAVAPSAGADPNEVTDAARVDEAPDAEIAIANTLVRVHAMFHVDPKTKKVQVSVVDEEGRLVRMIPPDSVSEMLAAMAAYPTRP